MPGRKKKVKPIQEQVESIVKRKVGRPAKSLKQITVVSTPVVTKLTSEGTVSTSSTSSQESSTSHAVNLSKRNSDLNKFYDQFLGVPLHKFPSSKLPLRRSILQRYRALREICHTTPVNEIVRTITDEVFELWRRGAIPYNKEKIATVSGLT